MDVSLCKVVLSMPFATLARVVSYKPPKKKKGKERDRISLGGMSARVTIISVRRVHLVPPCDEGMARPSGEYYTRGLRFK